MKIIKRINGFLSLFKSVGLYSLMVAIVMGSMVYRDYIKTGFNGVVKTMSWGTLAFILVFSIITLLINLTGNNENDEYIGKTAERDYGLKEESIESLLTLKDYYGSNLLYNARNPVAYSAIVFCGMMGLILAALCVLKRSINIFDAAILLFCLYVVTNPFIALRLKVNKMYKVQQNLQKPTNIFCNGALFRVSGEGFSNEIKSLYDIAINNDYLLLFLTPASFVGIPRRLFRGEEQFYYFVKTAYSIVNRQKGITV